MTDPSESPEALFLLPVFNDWESCGELIGRIDRVLAATGRKARFLVIDDGSTQDPSSLPAATADLTSTASIHLLTLRRNLGHQRAICVGLCVVAAQFPCNAVIVMDADGEDDPEDIPRLLSRWKAEGGRSIVFAERTRRSEGLLFRSFYWIYRVLHRVLTGRGVRVGNYSVIPFDRVSSLITFPELWSHYAAAVFVSRIPFATVPTRRGDRIAGRSSMNFQSLVAHGLSAVTVFSETVAVRVLLANLVMVLVMVLGLVAAVAASIFLPMGPPLWLVYSMGLAVVLMLLTIMFAFLFTFIVLFERKSGSMIPSRDFPLFVENVRQLHPQEEGREWGEAAR